MLNSQNQGAPWSPCVGSCGPHTERQSHSGSSRLNICASCNKYAWEVPFKKSKGPTDHWVQHHDHDFGILWAYTRASWHHEPFLCSTSSGRCLTACWNLIQDSSSAGRSEKSLAYSARSPAVRSDDSFLSCAEAISTTDNGQHAVAKSVKSVRIQSATFWSFTQHHNMLKSELKYKQDFPYLRPRGKGRKLAWHENTMMLRMRMLPNLLPAATCRRCPQGGIEPQPNCLWTNQPGREGEG